MNKAANYYYICIRKMIEVNAALNIAIVLIIAIIEIAVLIPVFVLLLSKRCRFTSC